MSSCSQGKKEVNLAYKFRPNQVKEYSSTIKGTSKILEANSVLQSHNFSYRSTLREKVIAVVDSSKARILLTNTADKSETPNEPQKSWSLEYIIENDGIIVEFFPEDSTQLEMVEYYKNYYEQAMPVFPDFAVSEGYSWTQTVKLIVKEQGNTNVETRYKVKSLVREAGYDCAAIEYSGSMIIPQRLIKQDGGLTIQLNRISTSGVIYFAYIEGMIIRQDENLEITTETSTYAGGITTKSTSSSHISSGMLLTRYENK
jgi:hypothetical protein